MAALLAAWLLTGIYIVRVDEQAIVRRFGAVVVDHVPSGIHLALPWGVDRVDRLKVREQKRLSVGFEAPDQALGRPANPLMREFLTGDQNLVNVELLVQYTIRDPHHYLFAASNLTQVLRNAAEAEVVRATASRSVDILLTTGKLEVQQTLQQAIQEASDHYGLGVEITAVNIQSVTPPMTVADAFRSVASAREDRDRIINEAESYANATLPAAQAEAARMQENALAYREQKVLQARGDSDRFIQAYNAYRLSPNVTRSRLYLEAIDQILPRLKTYSIDHNGGRSPVDLNLLQRSTSASQGSTGPAQAQGSATSAQSTAPAPDTGGATNATGPIAPPTPTP